MIITVIQLCITLGVKKTVQVSKHIYIKTYEHDMAFKHCHNFQPTLYWLFDKQHNT